MPVGVPSRFEVSLPGWDDIIHLTPESVLPDAELRARRAERARLLRVSPVPDLVEHLSQIGQEIDAVQDGLVTLSVLGRVATKVTGRAIPGVGAISTAADVLNAVNIFYPRVSALARLPEVTHIRAGGRRLRRWAANAETKRKLGQLMGLATGTYSQRLRDTSRTGRIGFGWGEALQILQTTDELAGVGVSLGPIFGAMQDVFFGALRGARFDLSGPLRSLGQLGSAVFPAFVGIPPEDLGAREAAARDIERVRVSVEWPGIFPLVDRVLGRPEGTYERDVITALEPLAGPADRAAVAVLSAVSTVKQASVGAAVRVWDASKWLVGVRGALSWETHIELLVAQFLALQELRPFIQAPIFTETAATAAQRLAFSDGPLPWVGGKPWSAGGLSAALRDGPAHFPLEWVSEAPSPEAREFTRALVASFVDLLFETLEGPERVLEVRSSDAGRALIAMHEANLLPPYDRSDQELAAYIGAVTRAVVQHGSVHPPAAQLERIFSDVFPGRSES